MAHIPLLYSGHTPVHFDAIRIGKSMQTGQILRSLLRQELLDHGQCVFKILKTLLFRGIVARAHRNCDGPLLDVQAITSRDNSVGERSGSTRTRPLKLSQPHPRPADAHHRRPVSLANFKLC